MNTFRFWLGVIRVAVNLHLIMYRGGFYTFTEVDKIIETSSTSQNIINCSLIKKLNQHLFETVSINGEDDTCDGGGWFNWFQLVEPNELQRAGEEAE